jgi:hypothetical protein
MCYVLFILRHLLAENPSAAARDAAFVDFHQLPVFSHVPHGHTLLRKAAKRDGPIEAKHWIVVFCD